MHVRVRFFGKPDTVVVVDSLLTTIDNFRRIIQQKFDVHPNSQKLIYGGKLLENGYTFYDYNIKLNDVIQLMVKIQSESSSKDDNKLASDENTATPVEYKDAKSTLYEVGDLVDMRELERGVWLEGKIIKIVQDPTAPNINDIKEAEAVIDSGTETDNNSNTDVTLDYESENKPLCKCDPKSKDVGRVTKNKDLRGYFQTVPRSQQKKLDKTTKSKVDETKKCDINSYLLYKVQLDTDDDDGTYCKLQDIRPRARRELKVTELEVGQIVMVNYDLDNPLERGYWYDFKISEIIQKLKSNIELIGTLYIGPDAVPQNDTKVTVHDKIFAIEQVVPLAERTKEYKKLMVTPPEKRIAPVNCLTCQDDEDAKCRDCGCYTCSGKDSPSKILLCDECNKGFHMWCLIPPITEIPKDDWYCPSCKRDPNDVIAPGGSKQMKKTAKSKRDWGRGMACVGKTRTCAMPANHFGPIPGIEVGMCWRYRIQLSETGVHRPPVSGIHGRDVEGAYSIVLSGGYEDDEDNGEEFTYTGSGGRDLSGNKRTAGQSCDQTLTRENKALARNCAVKEISEEGGDAGDQWRNGKPVRVVRSYKLSKHLPKYAPAEGIRYDGIYKVVKYYPAKGLSGFRVWKYLLRRDDPNPAPWEPEAKQYPIVYPDGHLEAEAEKKALKMASANKKKKRTLKESNEANKLVVPEEKNVSARKKRKMCISSGDEEEKDGYRKSANRDKFQTTRSNDENCSTNKIVTTSLSDEEKAAINADALNKKLWDEVVTVCNARGKKEFVEYVTQEFRCIICQDVVVSPVTTPCLHNFCMGCIKLSFKAAGPQCPCCRQSLNNYEFEPNEELKTALRIILPGYDAGKK